MYIYMNRRIVESWCGWWVGVWSAQVARLYSKAGGLGNDFERRGARNRAIGPRWPRLPPRRRYSRRVSRVASATLPPNSTTPGSCHRRRHRRPCPRSSRVLLHTAVLFRTQSTSTE